MLLRLALLLAAVASARALLVLPSSPPRGFNTFDNYCYDPSLLNDSSVMDLVYTLASSPLRDAGYSNLFGFSGWSQTLNTSSGQWLQNLDAWGRPVPAPDRLSPDIFRRASAAGAALGMRVGLWHIRGIHVSAAARRLPVKGMEQYTLDQLVDAEPVGGGANGSCLWDSDWLGVNASHPAAQAYYNSVVEQLVELGSSVIEADCFMCEPCYADEMALFSNAVKARPEELVLYFSPGGGAQPAEARRIVADNQLATFYRTITDFHGGWFDWGGLQQAIFIAGNFTAAGLHGANGTWPDLDMMPIDRDASTKRR